MKLPDVVPRSYVPLGVRPVAATPQSESVFQSDDDLPLFSSKLLILFE